MRVVRRLIFPLLFALLLGGAEIGGAVFLSASAPNGTRWLGDTIAFPSDVAVYLSYINQGKDGHVFLHNLYATEPHRLLFHPVWSVLALIAHLPFSPIVIHEGARVIFTFLLCAILWFIGRRITESYHDAKLFLFLSFAGVSTGWLFSIWLGLTHGWRPHLDAAPDVFSEFSAFPTLLGGAHVIFSLALLLVGLYSTWETFASSRPPASRLPSSWLSGLCLGLLLAIHPYFAPLLLIFVIFAIVEGRKNGLRTIIKNLFALGICAVPAILIYLPLYRDPIFRTHHLIVNQLPIAGVGAWLATLLPFILAGIWRIRKKIPLKPSERWIVAWIMSAIITIILPFPWKRKYTEGLGIACILLTFPAWLAVRDWFIQQAPGLRRTSIIIMVCIGAALSPLHLVASAVAWATSPMTSSYFYQSKNIFSAWEQLRQKTHPSDVVLTDNAWLNLWTPSYTGRTVATGHDHETPDFAHRQQLWKEVYETNDQQRLQDILTELHVTMLLVSSQTDERRLQMLRASTRVVLY